MSDILQDAAKNFSKLMRFNYNIETRDKSLQRLDLAIRCYPEEFTHILGLDHLNDIAMLNTHNSSIKKKTFLNILQGNFTKK